MHAGRCHRDTVMYASTAALCVLAAVLYPAAAVAQAAQPKLTAADVRRIALASARGARGSPRFTAATNGMQQAKALGFQINTLALSRDPTLAKVRQHSAMPSPACCPRLPCMPLWRPPCRCVRLLLHACATRSPGQVLSACYSVSLGF